MACWSLVAILLLGAFMARGNLAPDFLTWALLTGANALALVLAIAGLREAKVPPILYAGILSVFLIGGILQLFVFSYNVVRNPAFIVVQAPFHGRFTASDMADAYRLLTLGFVVFCLLVAVLASVQVRTPLPRFATQEAAKRLTPVLVWGTVAFAGFTVIQVVFGVGQAGLYNRALPFRLVTITLLYQRLLYPTMLLLGLWVFDRRNPKQTYLCLLGMALVIANASYISTSRGAVIGYGLSVLFLWLLTGRFTKFRKSLLIATFVLYLVLAPVLSALRVTRVSAASGRAGPTGSASPFSSQSLNYELTHFVFRVGGTGSLLYAMKAARPLSPGGLVSIYKPSGLTSYYTHEVVGVPVSSTIKTSLAPTAIGLGTLIGGPAGLVLTLIITILALDQLWRWMARRLRTWPVAMTILAGTALGYFSEGVPINLYKSLLIIGAIEVMYRYVAGPPDRVRPAAAANQVDHPPPQALDPAERRGA